MRLRVEERPPRVGLDLDAGPSARGPQRGGQPDRQRHRAGCRLEAVAVGHKHRSGRRPQRQPDVDAGLAAHQRSGGDVVGRAVGAEEDDLVGAAQPAAAQPQGGAAGRRLAVLAAPHARPPQQLRRGPHDDPGRRGRGRRGARRPVRGGRAGRDGGAARSLLGPSRGCGERQRDACGVCDCAPASSRGHPPMGHALLLDRWPAGLADGLARPHALPGGNAWIRPNNLRVPRSARPRRIRPMFVERRAVYARSPDGGVATITSPNEGGGVPGCARSVALWVDSGFSRRSSRPWRRPPGCS